MIIDPHTHAWAPPSDHQPWTNGPLLDVVNDFDVHTVYTANRLVADMNEHGVDEAVVVGYPIGEWTDNHYTVEVVREYDRLYGIVMIDQFADDAAEQLREYMAIDGVLGFRLGAACPYNEMWERFDPSVDWLRDAIDETDFWEAAVETDAAVQILCDHSQLDQAVELVARYPELTYLFDHFAHAGPETPTDEGTFSQFAELADYDNVAVKISEIPHMSDEGFPYADMHDHVRWFLDRFGRDRVIWGSDYPNVSDVAGYAASRHWLDKVDDVSETDREWLTGRAFCKHVGLSD